MSDELRFKAAGELFNRMNRELDEIAKTVRELVKAKRETNELLDAILKKGSNNAK